MRCRLLSSPFKNASGAYYTKAMFYEWTNSDKSTVVYTLKSEDHEGYPSLKRLYLECNDPSGYLCAVKYLGGLEHWRKLKECDWFQPYLKDWENELELKLRAEALQRLLAEAVNPDSKVYIEMNKLLLSKGWLTPEDRARLIIEAQTGAGRKNKDVGRPSDQKIKEEAMKLFSGSKDIDDDFARLTGDKIN